MVSISDVARASGVSVSTVSNYLNQPTKVSPSTASRIARAVDTLGYVPRLSARQLRWGRSGIVGISVVNASNPWFAQVVEAAEAVLVEAGLAVVVGSSRESASRQENLVGLFEQLRFDGVLVAPSDEDVAGLQGVDRRGTPVVLVDHGDPDGVLRGVEVDHLAGGRAAAEHLVGLGRRRFVLATGPTGVQQTARRERGFRAVVEGVEGATLRVDRSADLGLDEGAAVARHLLAQGDPPDAIFATNDVHALGIQRALLDASVRVPEDVALVGYDDVPFARYAAVPLTSVRQPAAEIGGTAARALLARLDAHPPAEVPGPGSVIAPHLVARASTLGGAPGSRPPAIGGPLDP
ncbi:LacI family transcriptional regulator [Sediminihabitans luteus]|uniref:LacI family transcriptional regulator n=1 Tax=Sediminihabitans luteus TaxID=1138585 RepID=A0A2M9CD12_9CELL|nr:LacI family DNA-binding transcriptional regulator [Sediminihabitans luteus]PJJ69203.1 LacI family transcriptional regulator [Sediminihabitans luteus]GII98878.1 LacI family transcriptional regulator [Sediminihabitans luteus]